MTILTQAIAAASAGVADIERETAKLGNVGLHHCAEALRVVQHHCMAGQPNCGGTQLWYLIQQLCSVAARENGGAFATYQQDWSLDLFESGQRAGRVDRVIHVRQAWITAVFVKSRCIPAQCPMSQRCEQIHL